MPSETAPPPPSAAYQWLTTQPNPRRATSGRADEGVTGWKEHAVLATEDTKFEDIRYVRAVYGLRARHGWGLDLFIDTPCKRCTAILNKMDANASKPSCG